MVVLVGVNRVPAAWSWSSTSPGPNSHAIVLAVDRVKPTQ
jgi:hypothetical protein